MAFQSYRVVSVNKRYVPVTADLTIHVSRDAPESLEEGTRATVETLGAVRAVHHLSITGVRPRLNDLAVGVTVDLTVGVEPSTTDVEAAVREALAAGFGVSVEAVALDTDR